MNHVSNEYSKLLIGSPASGKTSELIRRGIESAQSGAGTVVFLSEAVAPEVEALLVRQNICYRILDFTDQSTLETFDFAHKNDDFYAHGVVMAHNYYQSVIKLIEQFGEYPLDLESQTILLALCKVAYYHKNLTLLEIYNLLTNSDYLQQQLERIPLQHAEFLLSDRSILLHVVEAKSDYFKLGTKILAKTLALRLHRVVSDPHVLQLLTPSLTPTLSCADLCQSGQITFVTFQNHRVMPYEREWLITLLTQQIFLNQHQECLEKHSSVALFVDDVYYYPLFQKYIGHYLRQFRRTNIFIQLSAHSLHSIVALVRDMEECGTNVTFLSHPLEIPVRLNLYHECRNILPSSNEWRRFYSLTTDSILAREARLAKQKLPLEPTPYLFKA